MNDIITTDGEVVETMSDFSSLPALMRAEIDVQIATARKYPRNVKQVVSAITDLATIDETAAEESLYVLVRGQKKQPGRNQQQNEDDRENKPIEGPSIRLAEIAAQCFGNCRVSARVIEVNRTEKYVEAEGIFHDLQTNSAQRATVRRRISTKKGYLFSDDMIVVTGNAACSIAKRNAILAGIPRALYRPAYEAARAMVAGTTQTLAQNREKAFRVWQTKGVTPDMLLVKLGLESVDEITPDHIAQLRGLWATIKNGEATIEDTFSPPKASSEHEVIDNALSDDAPEAASDTAPAKSESSADAVPEQPAFETPEDKAFAEGESARERGISKKAVPPEYRTDENAKLAASWVSGWETKDAALQAGG